MQEISKELIGASSTPLILSILAKGESYGYEIIKAIKELSGGELEWSEGTLYPILHKLEEKGFIKSHWKQAQNGRKRKYYFLEESGKIALEAEKLNWSIIHSTLQKLWQNPIHSI
jgi:PadR family transcriptional regulator, regulatory protein PadR